MRFLAALAALFVLPAFAAQAASFDLPAQPLADAIRAVGSQTNTNVLFDPPLVADRSARPLKGDLSADQALTKILAGTGIKYEFLNDTTIVLASADPTLRARGEGAGSEAPTSGASNSSTAGSDDAKGAQDKSFWDRFRLAQVDQGQTSGPANVEKQD